MPEAEPGRIIPISEVRAARVRGLNRAYEQTLSAVFGESEGAEVPAMHISEDEIQSGVVQLLGQLEGLLSVLTDQERRAITLGYGIDDGRARSQLEIGRELGISRWAVSRRLVSARKKMNLPIPEKRLGII